jgi:hypothetical protein
MPFVRIVLLLLAAGAAAGAYFQERYRLAVIEKLSGAEALAQYERRRRRSHRTLMVVAMVSGAFGLGAIVQMIVAAR